MKDYSFGKYSGLAVIQTEEGFTVGKVSRRFSPKQVQVIAYLSPSEGLETALASLEQIYTQQAGAGLQVRIIRAATRAIQDGFFASEIVGNQVADYGLVDLGAGQLKAALAETEPGASFPFQYHRGGMEMAVVIAGAGAIEVGEDEAEQSVYELSSGDVVLIPPDVVYRVCNRRADEKLMAWVFFGDQTISYWSDGRRA